MGERVLESVFRLREEARLVDELVGAQRGQTAVELAGRQIGDLSQKRMREILADHGGGLQRALGFRLQTVDAGGEHGLDSGWDGNVAEIAADPAGAAFAGEQTEFD